MGRFSPVMLSVVTLAAACCAVVAGTALPAGASQPAAGDWGPMQLVPGLAADNHSSINALSCGSAGNCAAAGGYTDPSGHGHSFVLDETDGSWGTPQEIPGLAALDAGHGGGITSVSCWSAGNCVAGGTYFTDAADDEQGFVVEESGGSWGTARAVPGLAALDVGGGGGGVEFVSCASAGNCVAVGTYSVPASPDQLLFVADETRGSWGKAQEIAGMAAVSTGPDIWVHGVTCPSAGNCAVSGWVGYYIPSPSANEVQQGFVVEESDGSWGKAEPTPGVGGTPAGSAVGGLSCWSEGNCLAAVSGGDYGWGLVDETNGSWGTPQEIPGLAAIAGATVDAVACGSAGNCAVGGGYFSSSGTSGWVVDESGGVWGTAQELPGSGAVGSLSCGSAGMCAAGAGGGR